jgi:DnaK suppressor protein
MTRAEQKNFKRLLELKQAELVRTLHKREPLRVTTSADILEYVQNLAQRDVVVQHNARQWHLLREVGRALRRIETDTFGVCLNCEAEISARRLAAVPWTRFCIECQAAAETGDMESVGGYNFFQPRAA